MTGIDAVVFDFDGVVVNSEPLYEKAEQALFLSYGVEVDLEDIRDTKGLPEEQYLEVISKRYQLPASLADLKHRGRKLLRREFATALDYMPGFLDFFHKINQQLPTGLATSSGRAMLEWIFANTKIRNHFSMIVTADDVCRSKPYPDPYAKICRLLAVEPGHTLVIEDSINGLQSAQAAGTITVGLIGPSNFSDLSSADYTARNFEEIETLINSEFQIRKMK